MSPTERWTPEQLREYMSGGKGSKYRNKPEVTGGVRIDSGLEAKFYRDLVMRHNIGAIRWFCRQPRFRLAEDSEYRPDFLVCENDGTIRVVDCKGFVTDNYRTKRSAMKEKYGITIEEVKR